MQRSCALCSQQTLTILITCTVWRDDTWQMLCNHKPAMLTKSGARCRLTKRVDQQQLFVATVNDLPRVCLEAQNRNTPGIAVVEVGVGDSKDAGQASVVYCHQLRLGRFLGQGHEALYVLYAAEGLLPQLQVACRLRPQTSTMMIIMPVIVILYDNVVV